MPRISTYPTAYGDASVTDAVVTHDASTGDITIFAVNRSEFDAASVVFDLAAFLDLTFTCREIQTTFGVSEATARRDIDALVQYGAAHRVHGGAMLPPRSRVA